MLAKLQHRIYQILEAPPPGDWTARLIQIFLITVILLNVAAVMLATVEHLAARYAWQFLAFEQFSVAVFTVEYVLRLWVAPLAPHLHRPVVGRIRYAFAPLALVDLAAILPFYLPMLLPDLRFIRALRLLRLLRVLKIGRYSESVRTLGAILREQKEELIASLVLVLVLLMVSSSLMYFVEHDAQPEHFTSIPAAMWWGVNTLTTLGGGDIYPVTPFGKLLGGAIAVIGIGLFALPAGILASGFIEKIRERRQGHFCPHCGKDIHARPDSHAPESRS